MVRGGLVQCFGFKKLLQPCLESCVQLWALQYKKDLKLFESIQRRAVKMVKGLERKPYEKQLRALDLSSLEKKRLSRGLAAVSSFLRRGRSLLYGDQ